MIGENAFALKMEDESMEPELRPYDVLIINPDATPKPGNFVVIKSDDNPEVIIRRYKQLSISSLLSNLSCLLLIKIGQIFKAGL
jgi:SOS-response transcriptional repressor LexA